MYSCREVVQLIASDGYARSGVFKKLAVRLHLAMCRHCSLYWKELRAIAAAVRAVGAGEGDLSNSEIEAVKKRILADLGGTSHP